MRKGEILTLKWSNVDFKNGYIYVEQTKNDEPRKLPMNNKLTETLQSAKKVSKGEYVFSENGKPYRIVMLKPDGGRLSKKQRLKASASIP